MVENPSTQCKECRAASSKASAEREGKGKGGKEGRGEEGEGATAAEDSEVMRSLLQVLGKPVLRHSTHSTQSGDPYLSKSSGVFAESVHLPVNDDLAVRCLFLGRCPPELDRLRDLFL